MSSYDEVTQLLASKGIKDVLSKEEKLRISQEIHSKLPVSLEIMACFDEKLPAIDIDEWNFARNGIRALMSELLFDDKYYLFVKSFPKNFMLSLNKEDLIRVILDDDFCHPFAVFSLNLDSFLMEEDSGSIVGSGEFLKVILKEENPGRTHATD